MKIRDNGIFKVSVIFTVAGTKNEAEEMNQKLGRKARLIDNNKFVGIYTSDDKTSIEASVDEIKKLINSECVVRLYRNKHKAAYEIDELCKSKKIETFTMEIKE